MRVRGRWKQDKGSMMMEVGWGLHDHNLRIKQTLEIKEDDSSMITVSGIMLGWWW